MDFRHARTGQRGRYRGNRRSLLGSLGSFLIPPKPGSFPPGSVGPARYQIPSILESEFSARSSALPCGELSNIPATRTTVKVVVAPTTLSRWAGVILFSFHIPSVGIAGLSEGDTE